MPETTARPKPRPVSVNDAVLMRTLYEDEGLSLSEVGERVGRSASTVNRVLTTTMGVTLRRKGKQPGSVSIPDDSIEQARFMYEEGLSIHEVAGRIGLDYTAARNRLVYAGVRMRDRSESQRLGQARRRAAAALVALWELAGGKCAHGHGLDGCPEDNCPHEAVRVEVRAAVATLRA